jgi:hypothetical protein
VVDVTEVRQEGYWKREEWDEAKRRRRHRLAVEFYGALTAAATGDDPPDSPPSVPTCEQLSTPGGPGGTAADAGELESGAPTGRVDLAPHEEDAVSVALRLGVGGVGRPVDQRVQEAAELIRSDERAADALYALLERDDAERRAHALALLREGEGGGARRLAQCGRQSVQLECPEEIGAGGCGHDGNYLPITCDHRLCPDCAKRRIGQAVERYTGAVQGWSQPTFYTFTIPNVDDPAVGKERVQQAFSKLRQRGIPASGETGGDGERERKRWRWEGVEGPPAELWKAELLGNGQHELARDLQRRYVGYTWEDVTGVHRGRRIPWSELVRGGFYGVDVKQKGSEEYNVHLHVLADAAYIPQPALSAVWEDITGDGIYVDVRRIYDRGSESIEAAVTEAVAYACKPPEFEDPEDAAAFASETKGERMVQPFGTLHGNVPDSPPQLLCERCENSPNWWNYVDVVEGRMETVGMVHGEDGDRPPDGAA